jgi:hypothetical protein
MIASLMKKVRKIALDNRHSHSRIAKYTLWISHSTTKDTIWKEIIENINRNNNK